MLNRNLIQFGIFNKLLSVDKSMVLYVGRHNTKIFIREKSIRFDFKIWCLCDSNCYPYNMKIYQEKEKKLQDQKVYISITKIKVVKKQIKSERYLKIKFTKENY